MKGSINEKVLALCLEKGVELLQAKYDMSGLLKTTNKHEQRRKRSKIYCIPTTLTHSSHFMKKQTETKLAKFTQGCTINKIQTQV